MQASSTRQPRDSRLLAAVVVGLGFLLSAVIASIVASVASSEADRWAAHSLMVRGGAGPSRVQSPFFDDERPPILAVADLRGVTHVAGPRGVQPLAVALVASDFPEPPELGAPW